MKECEEYSIYLLNNGIFMLLTSSLLLTDNSGSERPNLSLTDGDRCASLLRVS